MGDVLCVDVTHLVLVSLGNTEDQVVDESADGPDGSDALPRSVVELDLDQVLLGLYRSLVLAPNPTWCATYVREADSQMAERLAEFSLI
jgi:hypothetical protein